MPGAIPGVLCALPPIGFISQNVLGARARERTPSVSKTNHDVGFQPHLKVHSLLFHSNVGLFEYFFTPALNHAIH